MDEEKTTIKTGKGSQVKYKEKEKKALLTATVSAKTFHELKMLIPEGKVSGFVDEIIRKSIKKIKEKIFTEYEEFNRDQEISKKLEELNCCKSNVRKRKIKWFLELPVETY